MTRIKKFIVLVKLFLVPVKNAFFSVLLNIMLLPLIMSFFLKNIYSDLPIERVMYLVSGSLMMTVISTSITTMSNKMNNMKQSNGMEFYLSLTISKIDYVLALLISELVLVIPSSLFVLYFNSIIFGIDLNIDVLPLVFYLVVLAMILMVIGVLIGFNSNGYNQCQSRASILSYLILFFSPIYFSVDAIPELLKPVVKLLPTTIVADTIRNLLLNAGNISIMYSVLLMIYLAISMTILVRQFKWEL